MECHRKPLARIPGGGEAPLGQALRSAAHRHARQSRLSPQARAGSLRADPRGSRAPGVRLAEEPVRPARQGGEQPLIKYPTFLVIAEPPRDAGNVIPLRSARVRRAPPAALVGSPPRRDTSWRDLVRRLLKNLGKD